MSDRTAEAEAIQARVDLIQETLAQLHGERPAADAALTAYLMAIDNVVTRALLRVQDDPSKALHYSEAVSDLLQSFQRELCCSTGSDPEKIIELSQSFKETIHDMLNLNK